MSLLKYRNDIISLRQYQYQPKWYWRSPSCTDTLSCALHLYKELKFSRSVSFQNYFCQGKKSIDWWHHLCAWLWKYINVKSCGLHINLFVHKFGAVFRRKDLQPSRHISLAINAVQRVCIRLITVTNFVPSLRCMIFDR